MCLVCFMRFCYTFAWYAQCAGLRRFVDLREKHAPGNLAHVLRALCGFWYFLVCVPNARACFTDLRKARPWHFGSCTLCILSFFVTFILACSIRVPAVLRRPQKKDPPGILEHVSYAFCRFVLLLAWCAQCACLQRFGDLRKNTPLDFWNMWVVYFLEFCYIFLNFSCFCVIPLSFYIICCLSRLAGWT
jgi:hypothetical protein